MMPPPPRSIDVRVWVTRPHIAVLEFPLSPNTSALLLEGEQGVYYRWQSLIIAQVGLRNRFAWIDLNKLLKADRFMDRNLDEAGMK